MEIFDKKRYKLGIIMTLLGAINWGLSGTLGQFLLQVDEVNPAWISSIRLTCAGIILIIFSLFKQKKKSFDIFKNKKDVLVLLFFAVFGLMATQLTYLKTIFYTNAATATVLQYTGAVMVVFYVCIVEKRLPSLGESLAIFLAMLGTFVLTTHFNIHNLVISKEGLIWGLVSALCLMTYTILPSKIISKYGPEPVTGFGMLIGGIILTLSARTYAMSYSGDIYFYLALAGMVIMGTALAFYLFLSGVNLVGPLTGSLLATIEPVASVFFSAVLLGHKTGLIDMSGIGIILLAVICLSLAGNKK
ncbi:DMT family transporter [Peptoniphilus sp. GNH]|nr:putative membrane protein [Clostridiales bacterium KA00134]UHR02287.1 DMT family transporter [Peptoniphilus sp. GNH]